MTTRTSIPSALSALGSAPATSAKPPVFEKGAHSEATKRTLSGAGVGGGGDLGVEDGDGDEDEGPTVLRGLVGDLGTRVSSRRSCSRCSERCCSSPRRPPASAR